MNNVQEALWICIPLWVVLMVLATAAYALWDCFGPTSGSGHK